MKACSMLMGGRCITERPAWPGPVAAAALAALALASCASGTPRPVELYRAQGENWRLRMFDIGVRIDTRLGSLRSVEGGELPLAQALDGGVRFEGTASVTFVVAGLVEEASAAYRLEIRTGPCRDRRGRMQPTSARLTYRSGQEYSGCGGPLPPTWSAPAPG
jgi:hypothetical protein